MPTLATNVNIRTLNQPNTAVNATDLAITLGDLHSNPMKLIHILVHHGIMDMRQETFDALWKIYDAFKTTISNLTDADKTILLLRDFNRLIMPLTIHKPGLLILIGDELADRGKNDFLMLIILQKLHDAEVPYWIQLSNHSLLALAHFEGQMLAELMPGQQQSLDLLIRLETLLPNFGIMVRNYANIAYKKHIKLIGYQIIEDNKLLIYTHAPIDFTTLKKLAEAFNVPIADKTTIQLIDQINHQAFMAIQQGIFVETYVDSEEFYNQPVSALYELLWNRNTTYFPREVNPDFHLNIHGHIGPDKPFKIGYVNLDTHLGKPAEVISAGTTFEAEDEGQCLVYVNELTTHDKQHAYYQEAMKMYSSNAAVLKTGRIVGTVSVDDLNTAHASSAADQIFEHHNTCSAGSVVKTVSFDDLKDQSQENTKNQVPKRQKTETSTLADTETASSAGSASASSNTSMAPVESTVFINMWSKSTTEKKDDEPNKQVSEPPKKPI